MELQYCTSIELQITKLLGSEVVTILTQALFIDRPIRLIQDFTSISVTNINFYK